MYIEPQEAQRLARYIARGLLETGVEGGFNSISCSTAGDYPAFGCSQWEGERAEALLSRMGGERFGGRTYTELRDSGDLPALASLLGSELGQRVQVQQLEEDCGFYVDVLAPLYDFLCVPCLVYAGMWCPTSHYVVRRFLENRKDRCDITDIETLHRVFREEYARAADCEAYAAGYAYRADITYAYVQGLNESEW